jgi:hypothetical protein
MVASGASATILLIFFYHPVKNSLNFCHPSGGGELDPTGFCRILLLK